MQILLRKSISLGPTGQHRAVPSVECVVLVPLYRVVVLVGWWLEIG
jgi:hypothetical protein